MNLRSLKTVGVVTGVLWAVGFAAMLRLIPMLTQMQGHWILGFAGVAIAVLLVMGAQRHTRSAAGRLANRMGPVAALIFAVGNWLEAGLGLEIGVQLFAIGIIGLIVTAALLALDAKREKSLPGWCVYPLTACLVALLPALNASTLFFGLESATAPEHLGWSILTGTTVTLTGAAWTLFSMGHSAVVR